MRDAKGISLFLVDAKTAGVQVQGYRTIDGMRAAEIKFANVKLGADCAARRRWTRRCRCSSARRISPCRRLCAEAVGAMEALNAATFEYLKTRQQFGRPIGSFQALQHRAVDMFIHCEQSRSMAYLAAVKVQSRGRERAQAHGVGGQDPDRPLRPLNQPGSDTAARRHGREQ